LWVVFLATIYRIPIVSLAAIYRPGYSLTDYEVTNLSNW
jgi:hypothetical protein